MFLYNISIYVLQLEVKLLNTDYIDLVNVCFHILCVPYKEDLLV